jgi:thiol-disulfide isomerase/thioredoxin
MRIAALLAAALLTAAPALAQDTAKQPEKTPEKAPEKAPETKAPETKAPEAKSTKLAVGDAAPALSVAKWIKGEPVTAFNKGHVYVVEFWATWCGPCIASMPHLSELQKEYKGKVTFIGVTSLDKRGNTLEAAEKMVAAKGDTMGYTVAWDNERATNDAYMKASGQGGIPCSFVVDKEGKLAYIGHPMFLDLVMDKVVAGTWDAKAGAKEIEDFQKSMSSMGRKIESDPAGALKSFNELEAKYPKIMASQAALKMELLMATGDTAGAKKLSNEIVDKAVKEKNAQELNAIAWSMVDPQSPAKNPDLDLALRAAEEGVKITGGKEPEILDTLARVYWAKGDKAKAIETQTKAVAAASAEQKDQLQKTLDEYKTGK